MSKNNINENSILYQNIAVCRFRSGNIRFVGAEGELDNGVPFEEKFEALQYRPCRIGNLCTYCV